MRTGGSVVAGFLALFTISCSAPHGNKRFHEHAEDFLGLILAESGLQLELLLKRYGENNDFGIAVNYFRTTQFRDLFCEVESIPEFKAVIEYLEDAHIDVTHMLESIDEATEHSEIVRLKPRKQKNGESAFSPFIRESINLFPKEKLAALFEEKKRDFPMFRDSMEKLKTQEWEQLLASLWESHDFKKAMNTLEENGLDVRLLTEQIKAAFGQN